jgi:FtsP/CotA-like multicopper oxidase with cupredoxin domain
VTTRSRLVLAAVATAVIVVPLAWLWWSSLLPDEYSVMTMGYMDYGGGQAGHDVTGHMEPDAISINELTVPADAKPDVSVDLTVRKETFTLESGRQVDGYTVNGQSPGPTIRATEGDLVEVNLVNESVPDGVALHWHGVDVPNAMDGVAGVTQDAVAEGGTFTYRFYANQVGTYWYHSHQISHEQVKGGLLGSIVVSPAVRGKPKANQVVDLPALVHIYDGVRTVNGAEGDVAVDSAAGQTARVRVINTDNGPMSVWVSGAEYRVVAVDGYDVHQPELVDGKAVLVTAGGRADLEIVIPDSGARVELGGNTAILLGPGAGAVTEAAAPTDFVDFLDYGSPAPLGFDPEESTRDFEYVVDRRPGLLDGKPGLWWTVNGHMYPDVPMFAVAEDDIVRMTIANHSGEVHPMHLHGHHAVVLSRDGEPSTGSPWWVDSLNVRDGETYDIAFVADNPGIWLDHCHNLPHATEGLLAHLMYIGYTTPYMMGGDSGNQPE